MACRGNAGTRHGWAGAYILFTNQGGEFALDCLTGAIHGRCEGDAVEFTWDGSDEMEPARGRGWAEELPDGSLEGEAIFAIAESEHTDGHTIFQQHFRLTGKKRAADLHRLTQTETPFLSL